MWILFFFVHNKLMSFIHVRLVFVITFKVIFDHNQYRITRLEQFHQNPDIPFLTQFQAYH